MDEQNDQNIASSACRVAAAADALEQILTKLQASQEALHVKIDRIIAAIEDTVTHNQQASADSDTATTSDTQERISMLERENQELKAQASRAGRKTLSPLVSGLLSKSGMEDATVAVEAGALDKALATLSLEQRIAVKAELARAGMIR